MSDLSATPRGSLRPADLIGRTVAIARGAQDAFEVFVRHAYRAPWNAGTDRQHTR